MDALSILVHATIWLVWLTALYMILTPLSDPPSPLLDLPPERLQFLKDELSSSDSRCAGLLRILKQQIEEINENIEIQRKLDQKIADESQRIKTAMKRLVARLISQPSRVGKATADVKLRLDRSGTIAEGDFTASRLPRRNSF